MPKPPRKPAAIADLPVLTEVPESDDLPVLTETLSEEAPPALKPKGKTRPDDLNLTEAQCKQIAEYVAPQLEAALRKRVAARMNALWPELWKEVQGDLPDMIRDVIIEAGRPTRK